MVTILEKKKIIIDKFRIDVFKSDKEIGTISGNTFLCL